MELLRQSDQDPALLIEAAIAFHTALNEYKALGDADNVCAMQANLFWCKKKMNLTTLQAYLASKGSDQARVTAVLAQVDAVVAQPVAASEAPAYLARADAFAQAHAEQPLAIAIRYFEVAGRFPDDASGRAAQAKSLEAMTSYSKAPAAGTETIFSKPSLTNSAGKSALPSESERRKALSMVRATFKEDYAKSKDHSVLAVMLLKTGIETKDDPQGRWALLNEAGTLASDTEAWHVVVTAGDALAAYYDGVDATALKLEWCARSTARGAEAVRTLLKNPDDPAANTQIGLLFVMRGHDLAHGLPLLARGGTMAWAILAKQELAAPSGPSQQVELADAWFEMGKKLANKAEKEYAFGKARGWYEQAVRQPGLAQKKAKDRLTEIDAIIPPPPSDWNNLTPKQWDAFPGRIVNITNSKDAADIGLTISDTKKYRLCPHPTDQWKVFTGGVETSYGWRGGNAPSSTGTWNMTRDFATLRLTVGGQSVQPNQILSATGKVQAHMECSSVGMDNTISARGSLRVKMVTVE